MRDSPCRSLLPPRQRRQKNCLMTCKYSPWGTPRGRYDEHSSRSFLSYETKVNWTSRRKPNFRRWCLLASWHSGQGHQINCLSACLPPTATWNLHNTNKYFAPNLRWGCQSHWFAINKGMSISSGNRIIVCKKVNRASNSKTVRLCKGNWTGVHSLLVVSLHKINKTCWVNKLQLGNS
jgi:hypothetical protein